LDVLLDTHTLLWWLDGDPRVPDNARTVIADEANPVYVRAASAWEMSTKFRIGKLSGAREVVENLLAVLQGQLFQELPIRLAHARLAGPLPGPHRNPFDRMLAAQAQLEELILLSNDRVFDNFGVRREWD